MNIWTFITFIYCKNCNLCVEKTKKNEKEAGVGPFFKKCGSCCVKTAKILLRRHVNGNTPNFLGSCDDHAPIVLHSIILNRF